MLLRLNIIKENQLKRSTQLIKTFMVTPWTNRQKLYKEKQLYGYNSKNLLAIAEFYQYYILKKLIGFIAVCLHDFVNICN